MAIVTSAAQRNSYGPNLSDFQRNRIVNAINTLRSYNSASQIEAAIFADIKLIINDFRSHTHNYYDLVSSVTGEALTRTSGISRIF